ncbi:chemotaxis protein CheW [Lysobacter sp. TY2-98]|uniref:chemotaxis protein CheW n=1 Tax=Lysobacter sp. TY2-98 TaxID=2290922 RepID=UPI000E20AF4E|nr:chemotaxis protein CheW [Lysobacter sp. TY2-98]AXK71168.1 chemotaxis protein CheW [Lysobacter sp. TY2-98]
MAPIDAYLDELLGTQPAPAAVAAADLPASPAALEPEALMRAVEAIESPSPVETAAFDDAIEPAFVASVVAPIEPPVVHPAPAPSPARALPSLEAFAATAPIAPIPRVPVAAPPGRARTATGGNRWLRVCVANDSYAFELLRVQEVVRVAPVVAMRGAAHSVLGVMNLRGRIVPVFDLGLWLDVGSVHIEERSRVVVIERDDELIGVLVTCVEDVVSLEREHVEPPLLGADPGPTLGVARVTDAPTVLLDADALFD